MALLVIIISVSAPSLANFFRGRGLDSEARQFVSLTRYAQSRAASEGVPMLVWIDTRQHTYGLRQEAGYTTLADDRAMEYTNGAGIEIRVQAVDAQTTANALLRPRAAQQTDPNIPTLRFRPDGFIDELSPTTIQLRDQSESSIWITQSRSKLHYEINTNANLAALR